MTLPPLYRPSHASLNGAEFDVDAFRDGLDRDRFEAIRQCPRLRRLRELAAFHGAALAKFADQAMERRKAKGAR